MSDKPQVTFSASVTVDGITVTYSVPWDHNNGMLPVLRSPPIAIVNFKSVMDKADTRMTEYLQMILNAIDPKGHLQ